MREFVPANRVSFFTESVIREMTRLANQHGAINLAQGMADFETQGKL
jgi:aminotransferase